MSIDQRALRNALGQFPTGVTVITADPEGYEPFGVTANSFASVSLDPPLVLWSLQKNSDTFDAFAAAKHFAINILSADQQDISNQYAKKHNHGLAADVYQPGIAGTPLLNNAIVSFECEVDVCHDGGDHIIMVGKVLAIRDLSEDDLTNANPLVFHAGKYRELKV
ncbi:flavin reductase family protein [bacterium]|nr:flavin reductase family protein [bacterium]